MNDEAKALVLILDERSAESGRAFEDLEPQFAVKRVVSVIGTNASVGEVAAVVLHLNAPESRAVTLINLLRGQRGLAAVHVFLLVSGGAEAVTQAVQGMSGVDVLELARAQFLLRARIAAAFAEPRRPSFPQPAPAAPSVAPHERLQKRFLVHSAERAQRALALCDELRAGHHSQLRRAALLEEVKDLLNVMKGEATMLRLRSVADILSTAEALVSRIDQSRAKLVVPSGLVSLFKDLTSLNASGASISSFDVDLHRSRLVSADDTGSFSSRT